MIIAPTRMSLPAAAAMPVVSMTGFSYTARKRLVAQGIVTALQVAEIASRDPAELRRRTGITATKARRILEEMLGPLPDFNNVGVSNRPLPRFGVPDLVRSPSAQAATQDNWLADRVGSIGDLPSRCSLVDYMQPVRCQGIWPTCVGFATVAVREYFLKRPLSAAYSYLGAKSIDGHPGDGSFLYYALQWQFQHGQVVEERFPYESLMQDHHLGVYEREAARLRSGGHSWLNLPLLQDGSIVTVMKAVLAGKLSSRLPQVPIAVAIRIYDSFVSTASALDGLIPLPRKNERSMGGHAMVVVGYIDAEDPANPFGLDYFVVRNSWGDWATQNPFGDKGHALIPARYFSSEDLLEAYVVLENEMVRRT